MTRPWNEKLTCSNCGTENSTESPLDAWIRLHPELDSIRDGVVITDGDKWVHRYGIRQKGRDGINREVQYLMGPIEIKAFGRGVHQSQRDTLDIVEQVIWTPPTDNQRDGAGQFTPGHSGGIRRLRLWSSFSRQRVRVMYYGPHTLVLSGTTPIDSQWMKWDSATITVAQLVGLFRFDLSPISLRPLDHRQHKRRITKLSLFGWPKTTRDGAWDAENDPRTDLFPEFEDGGG